MAKKTLIDDVLDAIQALCFHLPLWAVFLVALVPTVAVYCLVAVVISQFIELFGEAYSAVPFYAAIVAYLLSLAAGLSGWMRRKTRKELVAHTRSISDLRALHWREFEMLVGEFYRQRGYDIAETKGGADGGIDLDGVDPNGRRILIQCKHWKNAKIGVKIVRETLGVLHKAGAARAIVIGTGNFTKEALAFANGEPIELIAGDQLAGMLGNIKPMPKPSPIHAVSSEEVEVKPKTHKPSPPEAFMPPNMAQSCPQCGGKMVERIAKRGTSAGNKFLGCSDFPKCRHTQAL
ncbi:MAG: restriction endonuclease [Opitutaceae bacterium]